MDLITILASSNYIIFNKEIAKNLGIFEAILIGELFSEYEYYRNEEKAEDGWFYSTIENIEKQTQLTRRQQESAIKKLKEIGLIDVKLSGVPAKRYIKINREFQFVQNEQTRLYKMSKLDCTKCTNSYINNNKKNNKEKENSNNTIFSNSINEDISSYSNSNNFTNNNSIITKRKYFENEKVNELFMEFLQMRKKLKAINSDLAIKKLINILEKYNDEDKIQMIDNSIINSWKGIFEIPKSKQQENDEKSEKKKLNPPKWVDPKFFEYTMNGKGHIYYKGYEFRYDLDGNLIEE